MSPAVRPALEDFARKSAGRLAERYVGDPHRHSTPSEFFVAHADAVCLASLRAIAEAAFLERVAELEAADHG